MQKIMITLLIAITIITIMKNCNLTKTYNEKLHDLETNHSGMKKEINKAGDTIYKVTATVVEKFKTWKATKTIDSLLKINNINKSKIEQLTTIVNSKNATITTKYDSIKSNDSTNIYTFEDKWINIQNIQPLKYKTGIKNIISILDTTYIIDEIEKRKGINYLRVKVINRNPYSIIKNITSERALTNKDKKFSIGVNTGITYNNGIKPYWGIGIQYNIIKF